MKRTMLVAAVLLLQSLAVVAQVSVSEAWVRGSVPGQNTTGAFMQLVSPQESQLVAASSPLARSVEIHEMVMEGNVMKMRAVKSVDLPAGKTIEFKPGGYHLMLMGLTKPLQVGERVPLELTLQGRDGKQTKLKVDAEVRPLAATMDRHEHRH